MISRIKLTVVMLVCGLIVGCAGEIKPMSADDVASLSDKKAAVAYFYADKKINYNELVYKVLWNEYRTNSVSFLGLWDIESDLSSRFQTGFHQMGIRDSALARELLTEDQFAILQEDVYTYLRGTQEAIKKGTDVPSLKLSNSYLEALRKKGVDHLILVDQRPLNIEVYSLMNDMYLRSFADIKVFDTADGRVAFDGGVLISFGHDYEESPREIESNGLKILKEKVGSAVDSQFAADKLPKQMGFSNPM
ncbi:MAG: hypothetical protein GYB21_06990 [Oceanospirillales bacterium]|nr:hypothetical protein [Oceanospirillales bacterium]